MLRESAWSTKYIAIVPILSQHLKNAGVHPVTADVSALVVSAGVFGVASAPINRARIIMQDKLAEPQTPRLSYRQVFRRMVQDAPNASMAQRTFRFFQGGAPRSVTSALAGGLFVKGSEWYDDAVKGFKNK